MASPWPDQTESLSKQWSICVIILCFLAYNSHSAIPLYLSDLQCDRRPVMGAHRSCSTLHGQKAPDIDRAIGGSDRSGMSKGPVNTTDLKDTDREQTWETVQLGQLSRGESTSPPARHTCTSAFTHQGICPQARQHITETQTPWE